MYFRGSSWRGGSFVVSGEDRLGFFGLGRGVFYNFVFIFDFVLWFFIVVKFL